MGRESSLEVQATHWRESQPPHFPKDTTTMTKNKGFQTIVLAVQKGERFDVAKTVHSNNLILLQAANGRIRALRHDDACLELDCFDQTDRKAFAALAGYPVAEYMAYIRARRAKREAESRNKQVAELREKARRLGFKLVQRGAKKDAA